MKKICLVFTACLVILSACKKDEDCNWNSAFLNGKTFKLTKSESVISGVTTNIPLTDPCDNNLISYTATTFTTKLASGCTDPEPNGTYTVTTEGGKKYFNVVVGGSSFKTLVSTSDCSKYVVSLSDTVSGVVMTFNQTYTKQ
jgi:hypothetical protein